MLTLLFLMLIYPKTTRGHEDLAESFLNWKNLDHHSQKENLRDQLTSNELNLLADSFETQTAASNGSIIRPQCQAYVHEFSHRAAHFISCSIDNARPFRFCEGCVVPYTRSMTIYKEIVKNDETLDNCQQLLLVSDRVQVINSVKKAMENIWTDADCSKCFSHVNEDANGTVHSPLSDSTLEFLQMYDNFTDCVHSDSKNVTYNATVCNTCRPYYQAMNSKYDHLLNDPEAPQHVCMDIVDMINYTRLTWGEKLKCTVVHKEYAYVITVTIILLTVPLVFYTTMAFIGKKKQRKLMKQKRLAPFHQTSYGGLDSPRYDTIEYEVPPSGQGPSGTQDSQENGSHSRHRHTDDT